jgi:hypothetical protein
LVLFFKFELGDFVLLLTQKISNFNKMKKNAIVLSKVLLLALLFTFGACKNGKKDAPPPVKINPGFSEYISAYSSGVISANSTIRIKLANQLEQEVEPGTFVKGNFFSCSPKIEGKIFWVDNRTLELRPDNKLESGQIYECTFNLSELTEVPDEFKEFPFQFQVIKQNFRISGITFDPYSDKDLKYNKLQGDFSSADFIENQVVENIFKAVVNEKELEIKWSHDQEAKNHIFTIDSITRDAEDKLLKLLFDGSKEGIDAEGIEEFEIPSISNFKLMKMMVVQQPEQHVIIHFSDPLKVNQDFRGLVSIQGTSRLRFTIDGNRLKVYPRSKQTGAKKLTVERGILSLSNSKLNEKVSKELTFEATKPQVKLIGDGVIVPNSNGLLFPFQAVNLSAVDVTIIKIFENNIAQFLQVNKLEGSYQLKRVGRPVAKKKIQLTSPNLIDYGQWNTFSLDLAEFIQNDPGAIYRIELSFKKSYSLYPCDDNDSEENEDIENWDINDESENSAWDGIEDYYDDYSYGYDYNWRDRDNPCKPAYYRNKSVSRNLLASDLGIIAKSGNDKNMLVAITDVRTTKPLSGVKVEIYNYQQQLIATQTTDNNGFAKISFDHKPFLLIAKNGTQRGYLKLDDGSSLSLSMFDVAGSKIQKGIKGYLYGERGVWRPGDTLFLTFILEDKDKLLPENHPVTFELYNVHNQLTQRKIKTRGTNDFYSYTIVTDSEAPTGNWLAKVKVGGATFAKNLRIETVKPNRLKIDIDFGKEKLTALDKNIVGKLTVKWLHGAVAKNLDATIDVKLTSIKTKFQRFSDFIFDDPARSFDTEESNIFDGNVNENGVANFQTKISTRNSAPGMLKATFITRAFEEGGDYSIDQMTIPYAPYSYFVGIKTPKGDKARGMLLTDEDHKVNVVTVDAEGKPTKRNNLEVKLFKVNWRWWWQAGNDNLASYVGRSHNTPLMTKKISTNDEGIGSFDFEIKYPDWGRYFVRVTDPNGHSTGKIIYVDWPGWAGRAQDDNPGAATMLMFAADKKEYKVGESIKVTFPGAKEGRALVSLENGSKVVGSHWVETTEGENVFEFAATEQMSPTVYVNITLLQPHANTANDLPIRLYGVIPLKVEDPQTRLNPVLNMPDELSSEQEFTVEVSEKDGKEMTYTIAIVDEGLLDLTRFPTPDPWGSFYKREALGIKTWDIYDMLVGAYGGKIEQVFAIGGDEGLDDKGKKKADRFKPVVKYIGPFTLKKGKTAKHNVKMPKYIGAVRTMLVAGKDGAYGAVDKSTPVKSPLMLLATLPRVISPAEKVKMPVTVFAMDEKIKNVKLKVETNDFVELVESANQQITFSEVGDQDVTFHLKVKEKLGVAKIKIIAESGKEKAEYEMEIDVRIPNPKITDVYTGVIQPGETWAQGFKIFGIEGTNEALLDVANVPPIDFGRRLKYLIGYPHGCIEQTTSSVFPQLFLSKVMDVSDEMKDKIHINVTAGINRLKTFQLSDGGLGYWPGANTASDWGTSYAGHFMIEAEKLGYDLPIGFKDHWVSFQQDASNNWQYSGYKRSQLSQAYRLYTLALADEAEIGAMNRLREMPNLNKQAKWRLAAAYSLAGKPEIAEQITKELETFVNDYRELSYTYGSSTRDEAMILEALVLINDSQKMVPLIDKLSKQLSSEKWMSTQTTAYCLVAFSKLLMGDSYNDRELKYSYAFNSENSEDVVSDKNLIQHQKVLEKRENGQVKLTNNSETVMYLSLAVDGVPLIEDRTAANNNLNLSLVYKTLENVIIDPENIEQGTDFKVEITVKNPGTMGHYKEMALTQIFPSGWEIHNTRMFGGRSVHEKDIPTYQDIRDDRVMTYFDLRENESKTFVVLLNAAYLGEFYLPAIYCEAMYDNNINARIPGKQVNVFKNK